ncbi:MAG TPA: citrate lyase acyl carrier protein [Bacillota bacterium]|jgi:citrate lyase subunit beta/citryl-CoA lyase|nr:citrate lyase acyl carrier protein [Bacillota bacterium]HQI15844.1 citrate lyase acyl carrier protein [Bacillota bacterium]HQJ36919.1 citrate lyase acyl carrier protein [Bacillota bacterium]
MQLKHPAVAGTLESCDVQVTIHPNDGMGLDIHIESIVKAQFGDAILETVRDVLAAFEVFDASVYLVDKGALDWVIRSRMQAAICRAADCSFDWVRGGQKKKREISVQQRVPLKRTSLYVSGSSPVNMTQAVFYNEDCMVYDLEDSVPISEKDAARFLVYNAVRDHHILDKYVLIRINGIYSEFIYEDLEAAVCACPNALRIPKVESADEVQRISGMVADIERKAGLEIGSIELWCNIESYLGIIHASEIAKADPRVVALALGAEDFTASMKARRTKQGLEIFYARNAVLMACRSAGIDAIDAVFSDINDLDGLHEDVILTRNLGFDGKTVVHPRQIDVVNSAFTPSKKEIEYAQRVLAAAEEGKQLNKGAVTLDGSMIDKPIELRALTTLEQARAAGIKIGGMNHAD